METNSENISTGCKAIYYVPLNYFMILTNSILTLVAEWSPFSTQAKS